MYVHIGKELIIPQSEIITILDLEKILENKKIKDILKELKLEKDIINISEGINKSLIIVEEKNKIKGYISNISSQTIAKRIKKDIL